MKISRVILGFVIVMLSTYCGTDTDAITKAASRYWKAVIEGDYDLAYQQLTRASRDRYSRSEFEDEIDLGRVTDYPELQNVWAKETDFVIGEIQQRGSRAEVYVAIHAPYLEGLRERLEEKARNKNLYRRAGGDSAEMASWLTKHMEKEMKRGRFDRTVIDVETKLEREGSVWKVDFGDEER